MVQTHEQPYVIGNDASSSGAKALALSFEGEVLGIGQTTYRYVEGLPPNHCELKQKVMVDGLHEANSHLRAKTKLRNDLCRGICVGGAMHGLNVLDALGNPLSDIVCWDDARDDEFGLSLTEILGVPVPRRFTFARWLGWKARHPELVERAAHVLTPSGYATYVGCGEHVTLPGDASGMVGYMKNPAEFDKEGLRKACELFPQLLPKIAQFGECVGHMTEQGDKIYGWPQGTPWGAGCGDQSLGSLGKGCCFPGDISVELGQSIVVNAFGFKVILTMRGLIEALNSSLGEDWSMCCVTNGVQAYARLFDCLKVLRAPDEEEHVFHDFLADLAAASPPGAAGLLALPFFKAESTLNQNENSFASLLGLNSKNFQIGNIVRSFMEVPILILRKALQEMGILDQVKRVVLSGGGAKSKVWGQIVADVLAVEVVVSQCTEAVAFGAALNALAVAANQHGQTVSAQELAKTHCRFGKRFSPNKDAEPIYRALVDGLLEVEKSMIHAYRLREQGIFGTG